MNVEHPIAAIAQKKLTALARSAGAATLNDICASTLIAERAAISNLPAPNNGVSSGGSARLMQCADGWIAMNLPRRDDWDALPAVFEQDFDANWETLTTRVRDCRLAALVERGRLLELAIAPASDPPYYPVLPPVASPSSGRRTGSPRVLDLSALWAGPLCAHLLQLAGADVVKVESSNRPDGAREGDADFFSLLNQGKRSVALDLASDKGRSALRALISHADIVIESSRPRALEQMGLFAETFIADNPQLTWVSISGYGREEPARNWIAFGDDAAAAAGLSYVLYQAIGRYEFAGDAIADPLTGVEAAVRAWCSWQNGGGQHISLSMRDVVASHISEIDPVARDAEFKNWWRHRAAYAPKRRPITAPVARFGEHTEAVLEEWRVC